MSFTKMAPLASTLYTSIGILHSALTILASRRSNDGQGMVIGQDGSDETEPDQRVADRPIAAATVAALELEVHLDPDVIGQLGDPSPEDVEGEVPPRIVGRDREGQHPLARRDLLGHLQGRRGSEGAQLYAQIGLGGGVDNNVEGLALDESAVEVAFEQEDVFVFVIFECGAFEAFAIEAAGEVRVVGLILAARVLAAALPADAIRACHRDETTGQYATGAWGRGKRGAQPSVRTAKRRAERT